MTNPDFNEIHNGALSFAQHLLQAHGEFPPFGVSLGVSGNIAYVVKGRETEHLFSEEMVEYLQTSFRQQALHGYISAAGVCINMSAPVPDKEQEYDAICVRMAHIHDGAIEVFVPYSLDEEGACQLGAPLVRAGESFQLVGGLVQPA